MRDPTKEFAVNKQTASRSVVTLVLNWNSAPDTIACVRSCQKLEYDNQQIVVIDNGSPDGSETRIKRAISGITVIQTGGNLGYAGGNNVGFRFAIERESDYVLVLNNDTLVAPTMLRELVTVAEENPSVAMVSPVVLAGSKGDRIWYAGTVWDERKLEFRRQGDGQTLITASLGAAPYPTLSVAGCGFLITTKVLEKLGGFDEDFFLYWEEMDLSWRVRSASYDILVVPRAQMWHAVGSTFRALGDEGRIVAAYYKTRNRLLWASKHLNGMRRLRFMLHTVRLLFPPMRCHWSHPSNGLKRTYWNWRACAAEIKYVLTGPRTRAAFHGLVDYSRGRFNARSALGRRF